MPASAGGINEIVFSVDIQAMKPMKRFSGKIHASL